MRIVIGQASGMLQAEISQLEGQSAKCMRQINKLGCWSLEGMSGASVAAEEQRIRMNAAVVRVQLSFLQSLAGADRQNLSLVQALPTTSPGVLDTAVAQDRADRARQLMRTLDTHMNEALASARTLNAQAEEEEWEDYEPISLGEICTRYQSLISGQQMVVQMNESVLEAANRYDAESRAIYASVQVDRLQQAQKSVGGYLESGNWGSTTWATATWLEGTVRSGPYASPGLLQRFLAGDLAASGTVASGGVSGATTIAGIAASGNIVGELLGGKVSLKPYGTGGGKLGKSSSTIGIGVEANAEGHLAQGVATASLGSIAAQADVRVLGANASAKLGASLIDGGTFDPSIAAKAEASGSVLEGSASVSSELGPLSQTMKANGSLFTAEAEAGASLGVDGLEAKVGAEAYVAQGSISRELSLFGVKVGLTVEGSAGGAGGNAGGKVGLDSVEGEIGLGLGLGLGAKVKIDWGDALKGFTREAMLFELWWENTFNSEEAA